MDSRGCTVLPRLRMGNAAAASRSMRSHSTVMRGHGHGPHSRKEVLTFSLGALGVVYGDIGTSPLYALKECTTGEHGTMPMTKDHTIMSVAEVARLSDTVLGVLSMVFWALALVICIKYLVFVLRADNKGEGGILALGALVDQHVKKRPATLAITMLLALFGAGLLFGEGVITPAISVLGAMEGLEVATTAFDHLVVPITVGILIALFVVQRYGTHKIGSVFGWVMLVWFISIACAGLPAIFRAPEVLAAVNPYYAIKFFVDHGLHGFLILGSVVLVITGGEALYADMGHFGKLPIRIAWFSVVLPCILLSYFGQGANVLDSAPRLIKNPFYDLVEGTIFLYPMVVIATMAAIVASQALISGVYSITRQGMLLGFSPRVTVVHTSAETEGQIYIPEINYLLMVGCVALVLGFKTSSNLAAAYGIAVTGTMAITSVLYFILARRRFEWTLPQALAFLIVFLTIDLTFFSSNLNKLGAGGWLPLAGGVGLFTIMTTWWRGRIELAKTIGSVALPDDLFLDSIIEERVPRVKGTAVFMASVAEGIPQVMLHHVKHNKVLHEQVILLSVEIKQQPWVPGNDSLEVHELKHGFWRVLARVGFMQTPRVPRILQRCAAKGLEYAENDTTYYLGRQTLLTGGKGRMARWRKVLFSFLSRNARPPTAFFDLPPNRVVELGMQIEL
jgi:KUP system potassium uptake protein